MRFAVFLHEILVCILEMFFGAERIVRFDFIPFLSEIVDHVDDYRVFEFRWREKFVIELFGNIDECLVCPLKTRTEITLGADGGMVI